MRSYVGMFRLPGYPYVGTEVTAVLDAATRALDIADDPIELALDLAEVLQLAAQVVRDFAADLIVEQEQQRPTEPRLRRAS